MKKILKFSKLFGFSVALSSIVIVAGIISVAVRGINFGLDFKPGIIEEIRIAPSVMELTYSGAAQVSVEPSASAIDFVVSSVATESNTFTFPYAESETISSLAEKISATIEGVSAKAVSSDAAIPAEGLFVSSAVSTMLTANPLRVHAYDSSIVTSADEIRAALSEIDDADVKTLGSQDVMNFQIRMGIGTDATGKSMQDTISSALAAAYGEENIAVVKSDFIGSQFSKSLIRDSIFLVAITLVLIWIYSAFRFHWDFALAAVITVIHDSLIMIAFFSFAQKEFSTTSLAAILTIIGYSINASVVILDRVRFNIKTLEADTFTQIMDSALSATLSRSIITTITTLFAVFALFFFTTGTIHDFAWALIIGLVSGCYSSIFIVGTLCTAFRSKSQNAKPNKKAESKTNIFKMKPQA